MLLQGKSKNLLGGPELSINGDTNHAYETGGEKHEIETHNLNNIVTQDSSQKTNNQTRKTCDPKYSTDVKSATYITFENRAHDSQPGPERHEKNRDLDLPQGRKKNFEFAKQMRFTAWRDINIESLGYDPRSTYVEKFWLPFLGPSTILLERRIIESLELNPFGFEMELEELSQMLGLGSNIGKNSSIQKTLNRLVIFELARVMPSHAFSVRLKMPPLPQRYVNRLPLLLQKQHKVVIKSGPDNNISAIRTRARSLALSLSKLGHDRQSIENQLISWRFHPSVCYETLSWIEKTQTSGSQNNEREIAEN